VTVDRSASSYGCGGLSLRAVGEVSRTTAGLLCPRAVSSLTKHSLAIVDAWRSPRAWRAFCRLSGARLHECWFPAPVETHGRRGRPGCDLRPVPTGVVRRPTASVGTGEKQRKVPAGPGPCGAQSGHPSLTAAPGLKALSTHGSRGAGGGNDQGPTPKPHTHQHDPALHPAPKLRPTQ
jgi:hypothetical protein